MDLKLHMDKCFLGMTSQVLLEHIVNKKGLEVDINKVQAILDVMASTCV